MIHGSSGSSGGTIHALSQALAARGVETFAVDIRGHGTSGTRGDIGYVGQLEDDLADFVAVLRKTVPSAPLTLVGHSVRRRLCAARGGLADPEPVRALRAARALSRLRCAVHPTEFRRLGARRYPAHRRPAGAARRSASTAVRRCRCWRFAVPPNSEKTLVSTYTDRLMRNFAVGGDFRRDLAAATKPLTIISGADDELMFADKYAEAVRGAKVAVEVKVLDGINHMGIVSAPKAVSVIAEDVATRAMAGS